MIAAMRRSTVLWIAPAAVVLVAVAAMIVLELPEGMPWSYRARDGDPGLTRAARRMLPIAAAVDAFSAARGRCPTWRNPADADAVLAFVPAEMRAAATANIGGPTFATSPTAPAACRITARLTHDELLIRESDGRTVRWIYDRGDGSDPRPVNLSP